MKSGNLTAQYSVSKSESPFDAADQGYYYRTTQNNTFKNTMILLKVKLNYSMI